MLIQAPKGTRDILPSETYIWQILEEKFMRISKNFGFREIRTPVFEYTDVFSGSVGESTDIVQKEMYTFTDKAGRSITLRPEGTAGIVRSYIENGLGSCPSPLKLVYNIAAYRYENVAKGRYREFHQFGAEAFGATGPMMDAEIISMADTFLKDAGINKYGIELNSIGCGKCRPAYDLALKEYFIQHLAGMCGTCQGRLNSNPLRILDCKEEKCSGYIKTAPSILECLCGECREHFGLLKENLDDLDIKYIVNDRIVRGLDYYTKTVFEFVSDNVGAQGTICGGGRYDDLVSRFNGSNVPGIGFAMGVERLIMQMDAEGVELGGAERPLLFIASAGDAARKYASALSCRLRAKNIFCENDTMERSLKAQMKYADKIGALYVVVIGDDEMKGQEAIIKNMADGGTKKIRLSDIYNELTIMGGVK